jgi:hypothetical protein
MSSFFTVNFELFKLFEKQKMAVVLSSSNTEEEVKFKSNENFHFTKNDDRSGFEL